MTFPLARQEWRPDIHISLRRVVQWYVYPPASATIFHLHIWFDFCLTSLLWVVLDDGDWRNILQQERVKWYVTICVSPAFSRTICVKLTSPSSLEVSENRVNLRNFLLDSLTLFPLKPPFSLFLCHGWDRILSIASVYCILTRDTLIAVVICVGIHISPDISLWHCDTATCAQA